MPFCRQLVDELKIGSRDQSINLNAERESTDFCREHNTMYAVPRIARQRPWPKQLATLEIRAHRRDIGVR